MQAASLGGKNDREQEEMCREYKRELERSKSGIGERRRLQTAQLKVGPQQTVFSYTLFLIRFSFLTDNNNPAKPTYFQDRLQTLGLVLLKALGFYLCFHLLCAIHRTVWPSVENRSLLK